jgi:tetratricopeptide (TPR) repeat protein
MTGVWDDARRREVEQVIARLDATWATTAMSAAYARLDTYAQEWIASHTEACRATTVYGAQSEAMMDLRIGCLEHARMDLQATVDQLARADPEVLGHVHALVAKLPTLAACADVEQLGNGVAPPDAGIRDEVDALRGAMAGARAAIVAGRYDEADEVLVPLEARVGATDYMPLRGEYLRTVGQAQTALGHPARAQTATEEALRLALRTNHSQLAMESAAVLVNIVANEERRPGEGLVYANLLLGLAERQGEPQWLRAAHSALSTAYSVAGRLQEAETSQRRALELDDGSDLATTGRLHHDLGMTLSDQGHDDAALDELRIAVDMLEQALGKQHPALVLVYVNIGNVDLRRNRFDDASVAYHHALEISRGSLGPEHPSTIGVRFSIATVLSTGGRHTEAEAELRALLEIVERTGGPDHANVGMIRGNLAAVLLDRGAHAEAEAEARRALAVLGKSFGPEHTDVTSPQATLARSLAAQGRHDEAVEPFRRVLSNHEKQLGPDHARIGLDLTRLATSLVELGRERDAVPLLERAVSMREREAGADLATSRFELARALWPTDRDRARALAEQALPSLPESARERARTWLRNAPR